MVDLSCGSGRRLRRLPPPARTRREGGEAVRDLDVVSNIIRYEEGAMDEGEVIAFFQGLVDSGLAWELQGSYGRAARRLIELGEVHENRL